MGLQEFPVFVLKGQATAMMDLLIFYVLHYGREVRLTDGKRGIIALPGKISPSGALFFNPQCRATFYLLGQLRNGRSTGERQQGVEVVQPAIDLYCRTADGGGNVLNVAVTMPGKKMVLTSRLHGSWSKKSGAILG
jgi:hypothetical protein